MIGYLRGQPKIRSDYLLLITKDGVGYKVYAGAKLLSINKDEIEIWIYSHVREDRFELYGFLHESDLRLFELLLGVSGCGPKMALTLADAGSSNIVHAIQQADVTYFTQFPRVGKKLAQKLIIELKNKLGGLQDLDLTPKSETYQEVQAALLTLGFGEAQITAALASLDMDKLDTASAVKLALQQLSKKGR